MAPWCGAAPPAEDVLVEDYQLNEAMNVLKGLNILKARSQQN